MSNKISVSQNDTKFNLLSEVIEQLSLDGYEIDLTDDLKSFSFIKSFKKVILPLNLINEKRWIDIRQKFRSQIDYSPQLNNFGAQNDWD